MIAVVVILAAAGILMYRSTAPEGDVVPEGTPLLKEEEPREGASGGQFLKMLPSTTPPAGVAGEAEGAPAVSPESREAQEDEEAAAGGSEQEEAVISMTDTGFQPETLAVSAGTTVTFVNNGQAPHWPASAVHPEHEVLPEFDAERGLATGEEYQFTFTQKGQWSFHDHLHPQFTGTITVE